MIIKINHEKNNAVTKSPEPKVDTGNRISFLPSVEKCKEIWTKAIAVFDLSIDNFEIFDLSDDQVQANVFINWCRLGMHTSSNDDFRNEHGDFKANACDLFLGSKKLLKWIKKNGGMRIDVLYDEMNDEERQGIEYKIDFLKDFLGWQALDFHDGTPFTGSNGRKLLENSIMNAHGKHNNFFIYINQSGEVLFSNYDSQTANTKNFYELSKFIINELV